MASETRDDPPVSTTMPSAVRGGLASVPRSCERNPPKPMAAAAKATASALASTAAHLFRGAAEAEAIGWFVDLRLMAIGRHLFRASLSHDRQEREPVFASQQWSVASFDIIERRK